MYALTVSAEGDCYLSVPPDPSIAAAALGASASAAPGASESALSGFAPTEALHTFTLDSGASRSFFRDRTTLTPLSRPVAVSLADPSGGPVLAHSSTVLPCPAAPLGLLSGLHLPSFSTNLVSGADLQDAWVDKFALGGQRLTHCTCSRTGRHVATFTRRPGSSLYTLTTAPPPVSASGLVAASSQVFAATSRSSPASAPCSCRPLTHETLLWHHRLGHPSLPRLRGMASPRRSSLHYVPSDRAPVQTLHTDVWGPARVRGQGHERYFLLVVDDYSRYTTVFPLRSKGDVTEGIRQTFTLPASPQQNGIAERCIGMVMDVARTSMIHAAAPHFLWPFAVQYAAHQINLQPRVSLPETTPTLRWTGKVGDASAFRVWGSRAFVRDTSADKMSFRAVPCVFLGFPPDAPGWQFYHPTSRRVLSSQDVTFDESVSYYQLLSPQRLREWYAQRCRRAAVAAGGAVGAGATGGAAGAGAAGGAAGAAAARAAAARAAASAGATGGVPGVGAAGGISTTGTAGAAGGGGATGGAAGAGAAGAAGPGGACTGGTGTAGTGGAARIGAAGTAAGGAAGVVTGDPGAEGNGAVSAPVQSESQLQPSSPLPGPSPYSGPTRGLTERREPESTPVSPVSRAASPVRTARAACPSASSLPYGPDPESDSLHVARPTVPRFLATAIIDPLFESSAASNFVAELVDFAAACRLDYATSLVAESASICPTSVRGECALGTDVLEDRQEEFECFAAAVPHLVSMLLAPEGDPDAPDIPTPRSYTEAIEGPYSSQWQAAIDEEMASWKSTGTYVDEVPPLGANIISGMWIFRVKRPLGSPPIFKARYVACGFSQRQGVDFFHTFSPTPKMTTLRVLLHVAAHRYYELHSLDFSTAFLQGSLHEEIWLRRPPGFTGTTLAALGFAPSTADPSLSLRTDTTLPPFYDLVYVDDLVFATADTEALAHVKSELQKRHACTDLDELTSYLGLRITRGRAQRTITLTQSHMVQKVLQRFGFTYSSPQSIPLPTGHSLSAPPSDESVEPSGPYPELVGCLIMSGMGLVLGGQARVVLTGHADASWVDDLATQRSSQGYTFSLGSGSVSWRSTRSSSVLSSSCEAEIYAGAMAAQELRWLTYLLTDLGEVPRSPPILYEDNKAMNSLC
ncbi:unnamed protein product [Closterium sp. NIES-53]